MIARLRGVGQLGLVALLAVAPIRAAAQPVAGEMTFGYFASGARPLVIDTDSLGLYAPGVVTLDSIAILASVWGGHSPRALGRGLYTVALAQRLGRPALAALARRAMAESGGAIPTAGMVVRAPGGSEVLFVTDVFIVEFGVGVSRAQIDSISAANRVRVVTRRGLLDNDYLLSVTPESREDALAVANRFHEAALTVFAHPNYLDAGVERSLIPDDPLFPDQWHLHNTGNHGVADADIDAPEAWDLTLGSPSIRIAILEIFGFDTLNLDLRPNLWQNPGETPGNGADDADAFAKSDDVRGWNFHGCVNPVVDAHTDPCGTSMLDANQPPIGAPVPVTSRHGNAVAGLAAARGGNALGVSGVCPQCSLMLISVDASDDGAAAAIRYAWEMGADVMNLSWGASVAARKATEAQLKKAVTDGRGGKGTTVVISASEQDDDRCATDLSGIPELVTVTGSDDFDRRASRSGFGACIDIMAPGWIANVPPKVAAQNATIHGHVSGIVTTDRTGKPGYNDATPEPNGCKLIDVATPIAELDYTRCFSGTSAAAPIVAGVVGLMLSQNPNLKAAEVKSLLYQTADRIEYDPALCPNAAANPAGYAPACPIDATSWSKTHGSGRVNAFAAVAAAAGTTGGTGGPTGCTPSPCPNAGAVEFGARMGATILSGGVNRTTLAVPGGGPLAVPALYAAWFPSNQAMLELHVGGARHTGGTQPDERVLVAALHPGFVFASGAGSFVAAASFALRNEQIGTGPSTTDTGAGAAIVYRFKPRPYLALRFEALYRRWFAASIDEIGLTFAFGVVLN